MTTVIAPGVAAEAELDLTVARKEALAEGVVRLTLTRPGGSPLPEWTPGAHVDLCLGPGLVRQYSLCSDPADRSRWQVAVLREPESRGGSEHVHDRLHEGARVRVRGPRNRFPLEASPRYLFIAGGIGITPILPMIAQAERQGAAWHLAYGGRRRATMAFREQLRAAYGKRVTLHPQDECGLLDLNGLPATPQQDTLVYCCGPEGLLKAVEQHCSLAWPPGVLRLERFAPADPAPRGPGEAFEVELARSGITVSVPPGRSVLQAVEEAGVPVLSSCREGTCGTCETAVLDGAVDHRDSLLTPDEQAAGDTMFICVSRAACPRLVLDL
ncbi:PDR/VanB family oxidoreductase [Streptomyces xinghaiensis]|uniref:PDR/VanB family oxidoreductase n=1 Tax=Streptomyces xinghaiensis TaxID=1038928 RepID=UPI002E101710|nr:PDR/VanB family oxidoreductase [Streptomyces xinghaiensis]